MAKTEYQDSGTWLTADLQNAYWGTDGTTGHVHDGTDTDGSVPKIQLSSALECQGVLPGANIQAPLPTANVDHTHGVSGLAKVDLAGAAGVTGDLPLNNMATWTGGSIAVRITDSYMTAAKTGTMYWTALNGHVNLYMTDISGTSNANQMRIQGDTDWAAGMVPATDKTCCCIVIDDGEPYPGTIGIKGGDDTAAMVFSKIHTGGAMYFSPNVFSGSGGKGISAQNISFYTSV